MFELRRKLRFLDALMAMLVAVALLAAPAWAGGGLGPCQPGPQIAALGNASTMAPHAHHLDRTPASVTAKADHDLAGRLGHHSRDCCDLGCPACVGFVPAAQEAITQVTPVLRFVRSADVRVEGRIPAPLLGPPRSAV